MACLFALVLAAAVLTVPPGKLTHAARTTLPAEAFWRAALPDVPIPDAILELLHPSETSVPNGVKHKDNGDDRPPMNFKYDDYRAASTRNGAAAPSANVLKHVADDGARTIAADSGDAAAWPTVFFLEDAVRAGESLPFRRTALTPALRPRTVRAVRAVAGSSFVLCRREGTTTDAVYGCRGIGPARVYSVVVAKRAGDEDAAVTASVVCRTDTARWDPDHVAFRVLGVKPGGAAVCYTVPPDALILSAKSEKSPSLA